MKSSEKFFLKAGMAKADRIAQPPGKTSPMRPLDKKAKAEKAQAPGTAQEASWGLSRVLKISEKDPSRKTVRGKSGVM